MPSRDYPMDLPRPLYEGGCACGAVRFEVFTPPRRSGLCHCMTCRKAHGAVFNPFVVFARRDVRIRGEVQCWESSPGYRRAFCNRCGSRVFGESADEFEISMGSFNEPSAFRPEYELWVAHREAWLAPLPLPQFEQSAASGT
jgi:hypothetical protein